jgi:tRNA threonylcarbamoyl adenosine modification protein YeaZ
MKHAENLIPVIDRLLKKEKMKISDIDAFLISRGPGSFTGLRIGFATLKGFLAIDPKPCYGASSLDVIAAGIQGTGEGDRPSKSIKGSVPLFTKRSQSPCNLTVCLDARRGKLYARSYHYQNERWMPDGPSRVALLEEISQRLPSGCLIAGDGINKFDAKGFTVAPEKSWIPRSATLIKLFEAGDPLLKKLSRPKEFLPVDLRSSEAEVRVKDKKHIV